MVQELGSFEMFTRTDTCAATAGAITGFAITGLVASVEESSPAPDPLSIMIAELREGIYYLHREQQDPDTAGPEKKSANQAIAEKQGTIQALKADQPSPPSALEVGGLVLGPATAGALVFTVLSIGIRRTIYNTRVSRAGRRMIKEVDTLRSKSSDNN